MKFAKGVMLGGLITTGIFILCIEGEMKNNKTIMKKGKKIAKKIGVI